MNSTHKLFTPPQLIFTLLLALAFFAGCSSVEEDTPNNNNEANNEVKETSANYTVMHYQQNANDDKYTAVENDTETLTGTVGSETTAAAKSYAGFTAQKIEQVKIAADGSTVVKIYYDRKIVTLTLNCDNGTAAKTITGKFGADVKVDVPTKTGYTFATWNPKLPATFPAENAQYTAKWLETYTITYELNDGTNTNENPDDYNAETETITLKEATKAGYVFDGWYKEDSFTTKVTEIAKGSTGNITLYAKWSLETYTITYELNGGTAADGNPESYNVENETRTLKEATKADYTFDGWYKEDSFTTKVTEITKGWVGNVTLYAKWLVDEKFVLVKGATITGNIANSKVFVDGRTVEINDFYMGDHEVTQAEYKAVIGSLPYNSNYADGDSDNNPVNRVRWYDAIVYCNKRSIKEGLTPCYLIARSTNPKDWGEYNPEYKNLWDAATCDFTANGYRLPTEVEWEYAARGGNGLTGTQYTYAGSDEPDEVAWYWGNSDNKTHEVKTKKANALKLYDMTGNVQEWCWDWYSDSISGSTPDTGSGSGSDRCSRGFSWNDYKRRNVCWVYLRDYELPVERNDYCGFRVVRTAE